MIAHKRSTYRGDAGWLVYGRREAGGWPIRVFVADSSGIAVEAVLGNVKAGRSAFEGLL